MNERTIAPAQQILRFGTGRRMEFCGRDVVRVVRAEAPEGAPHAVLGTLSEAKLDVRREGGRTVIRTGALRVETDAALQVDFYTAEGEPVSLCHRAGRTLVQDTESSAEAFLALEGHIPARPHGTEYPVEEVRTLGAEDCIYGLGDKIGPLDRRGYEYEMWNTDNPAPHEENFRALYKSIPFFIVQGAKAAYGFFFDNHYHTYFDLGKENAAYCFFAAEQGNMDYYFIYGPTIAQVVEKYTALTGRMPLPPLWTLGYHQSRWGYESEEAIRAVADGLREHRIPCSCIHFDIDYMEHFKVFTWNRETYRDPRRLLADLRAQGIRAVTIIDPGVKQESGYPVYEQGVKNGYFATAPDGSLYVNAVWPGDAVFPDFGRPEVRAWWGGLHAFLADLGVEGIWDDMNEPASFRGPLPDDVVFSDEGETANHAAVHNLYGHNMARATYEGMKRLTGRRPFVLTRACYSGTQRYSAVWTGDNHSLWTHLRASVAQLCSLGLCGFAFAGADVGGFGSDTTPELLVRWTQVGCLSPFFRNHCAKGGRSQEPWAFDARTLDICRRYIELRYRLMPYLYDAFRGAAQNGWPVMRPLVFAYADDAAVRECNDEFLVGEALLAAPVLEQGARMRMVYLPQGVWYDYWTGERLEGRRWLLREAPLDTCPLYVREGTILPVWPVKMPADTDHEPALELEVFGAQAACEHYQDDGVSFAYEDGAYNLYQLRVDEAGGLTVQRTVSGCTPYASIRVMRRVGKEYTL